MGRELTEAQLGTRQFSDHHISRVGGNNHPSVGELVRHRFSAFWLSSKGRGVFGFFRFSEKSVKNFSGGIGFASPPSLYLISF